MTTPMNPPATHQNPWTGSLKTVSMILSIPVRWKMLYMMAQNELVSVSQLATVTKQSRPSASMHVRVLLKAGLVQQTIGRLYRLNPALRPSPGADFLDLGLCRINIPAALKAGP